MVKKSIKSEKISGIELKIFGQEIKTDKITVRILIIGLLLTLCYAMYKSYNVTENGIIAGTTEVNIEMVKNDISEKTGILENLKSLLAETTSPESRDEIKKSIGEVESRIAEGKVFLSRFEDFGIMNGEHQEAFLNELAKFIAEDEGVEYTNLYLAKNEEKLAESIDENDSLKSRTEALETEQKKDKIKINELTSQLNRSLSQNRILAQNHQEKINSINLLMDSLRTSSDSSKEELDLLQKQKDILEADKKGLDKKNGELAAQIESTLQLRVTNLNFVPSNTKKRKENSYKFQNFHGSIDLAFQIKSNSVSEIKKIDLAIIIISPDNTRALLTKKKINFGEDYFFTITKSDFIDSNENFKFTPGEYRVLFFELRSEKDQPIASDKFYLSKRRKKPLNAPDLISR